MPESDRSTFDFVIVGSGFGGSVSALRLAEKGYRILVLEQGRRFGDSDFPKTNWQAWDFLWLPALRLHGFMRMSLLREALVFAGCGVGGGSLVYANVLMEPDPELFEDPAWRRLADWQSVLRPHYATARRMLGVTTSPRLVHADRVLHDIASDFGLGATFRPTQVGVFFGEEGVEVPDPYFDGEGPARSGCTFCGGCMVGCRHNAKNMLTKNYLYLAEKKGVEVRPEAKVIGISLAGGSSEASPRYVVHYRRTTRPFARVRSVEAAQVVVSAGTLGTIDLLLRCREDPARLPRLSPRVGEQVRTNSEALLGSGARRGDIDYSKGIAISSDVRLDAVTHVQPVRYPAGSSFIRLISTPMIEAGRQGPAIRLLRLLAAVVRHPVDFLRSLAGRGWAERTTILLVMQRLENYMRISRRRRWPFAPAGLHAERDRSRPVPGEIALAHRAVREFSARTNGAPMGSLSEMLLGTATTAHLIGGCPMGTTADEGVVDSGCRVHNYPGLYVIDGTVLPANPGINPSLTIAALAEYATSLIPANPSGNGS